jgi:formylglycine-generating enzyme required for sulfatase activity
MTNRIMTSHRKSTLLLSALFFMITYAAPRAPAQNTRKPYVETIPGTAVKFEMVPIPAAPVSVADVRGGAAGQKKVKALWMGKTEVTWDAYDIFAFRLDQSQAEQARGAAPNTADATSRPSKPYGAPDRGFGHQGYAAIGMTYQAAQEYCRWLSGKTGKKYRLPTEAEWEYAARAGMPKAGPLPKSELDKYAWYWDNAEDKTQPVGTKLPNAWGLHDMLGNVAEWCAGAGGKPVVRGGSYNDKADDVHAGARAVQTPEWNATDPQNPKSKWWLADAPFVGFRVVREE